MNILYIIGNGLDIAHHMKTSYQDFFQYYLSLSTDDKDILAMKKDIDSHRYETWADLEIGLGTYASKCADKDTFLKCLLDIKSNLKDYLVRESEKIKLYRVVSNSGFVNPGQFLDPEPQSRYEAFRLRRKDNDVVIDVLTLNYTQSLESLLGFKDVFIRFTNNIRLQSILHIHGTLDSMMVMGVNDSNQISNIDFNTDIDVVEEFVKPEYNDACMNNKNGICEGLIQRANIIVLYGTSLGKSDEKWWRLIGQRMMMDNYPLLVYLPYDERKNQSTEPNHLRRWTLGYVNEIRDKFAIQLDEKDLAQRVCIALNKHLFQITKAPLQPVKRN